MNLGIVSLILLLVAIVVGFARNVNVGILCIGFAMVLTLLYGDTITAKQVIEGFGTSLFIQMVGVTYLFAIINGNGTLELMARKIVNLVPARAIPLVMFFIGMALSAAGPGSIPCLAIIPVIAIPISVSAGINPIMTAIIGDMGAMAGRMSPLTPEAAVVRGLMEEQGMDGNTVPIMLCTMMVTVICALLVYVYYKGWTVDRSAASGEKEQLPKFTWQQWLSLLGLVVLAFGVLVLSWNVGLTGFLIGTILVILGCGNEKKAVAGVPWNVILMVLGVGMLMNILSLSGGIDIMVSALESIMGPKSAAPIMALTAGIMSFFSSGLGVVFPTLVPICGGLASGIGADGVYLVAMAVIGGTIAGYTPISTTGALIMAGVSQQKDAETRFPQNKLFIELFAVSFINLAVLAVTALIGIYGLIV
ncbi:SLC13 family permease [Butyricicoccus sp.]|uniref:SLC13 family permease n=1 Tax=Butyricicoccus sp. TaxID=2049021 RepID=UPI003F166CC0